MARALPLLAESLAESFASRFDFLDGEPDACGVVGRRMELLYLNHLAKTLVPPGWFGFRCWQAFPVGPESCANRCPAVGAVTRRATDIVLCEETLFGADGTAIELGVAVVPVESSDPEGERAVLLMRLRPSAGDAAFHAALLESAERLRARCAAAV